MASTPPIHRLSVERVWAKFLLYSDPGVGKTTLLAGSPKCLILEADRGEVSAAVAGSTADIWRMTDWNDMNDAEQYLRHEGANKYEWVWLDGLTLFQELGLDNIMDDLVAQKPHRNLYVPDRAEYGENMSRLSRWLRAMKALPINFGITAHVLRTTDRNGDIIYVPAIRGKDMWERVCGYFDLIGFMEVATVDDKPARVLRLAPPPGDSDEGRFIAKDRYNLTKTGYIVNPTMQKIINNMPGQQKVQRVTAPVRKGTAKKQTAATRSA